MAQKEPTTKDVLQNAVPPLKGGAEERGGGFFHVASLRLCVIFLFLFPLAGNAQTAKEIIEKADELTRGLSSQGSMTIQIVRPKWSREMTMKSWTLGTEYSLILITSPAKEKGTVFLKREKEIWNWVPSIERTVKLPPSMMMQSWMGTDLTNDDLVKESSIVVDYTHKLEKDTTMDGRNCWKLVLTAKPDAPVVWGSIITYVDKDTYIQMRSEFYDEDGFLVNVFSASDIKEMGGRTLAGRIEIDPVDKPGQKTVIIQNDIKFNTGIQEDFFTTNNMKRVK
ncbi:MAG: outer membrane lipoprotein-sorting protein [Flavobacteriales bacterium]|nr:outer membrane lipoprotein-sorting protein [Flavobacteriales bacterium]